MNPWRDFAIAITLYTVGWGIVEGIKEWRWRKEQAERQREEDRIIREFLEYIERRLEQRGFKKREP